MRISILAGAFVLATVYAAGQQQLFDGKTWWHHVQVLASDDMEGRGVGSHGLRRAEKYVVTELEKLGIAPAASTLYYQPVRTLVREVDAKESTAVLTHDGTVVPITLGEDAVFTPSVDLASSIEAPLVFIGWGLRVPEKNHDDFAGLDLKGKIAVSMSWPPPHITGLLATHYLSDARRWEQLRAAGAVGWIRFAFPGANWSSLSGVVSAPTPGFAVDAAVGARLAMLFNPARAEKLFARTGHSGNELIAAARAGQPLPRFEMPIRIRASARTVTKSFESANVIGRIEGSDPQLKNEYVVASAHLDGRGILAPINGDAIFNGAIDNASGVAALLDVAAQLKAHAIRPRRSVLLAFFTAEEGGGLLGSKYFVAHPTVPAKSIVANINVDNVQVIVPLTAIEALGMDDSSLGETVRRVIAAEGLALDLDSRLGNSDHLSFIDSRIPAIKLNVGFLGDTAAIQEKWRRERYQTPFDDLQQPINLEAAAKYEQVLSALLLDVANSPRRVEWKPDSFYRRYAAK
jgi:hypothetical protein